MQFDDIQQQATIDLARFIAPNHFQYRGHTLAAYQEIAEPLIRDRQGLTNRELCAAKALVLWTRFEEIERAASSALVRDSHEPPKTIPQQETLRIDALRHNVCKAAHDYAIQVGDPLLIEAWPELVWMAGSASQATTNIKAAPTPWHLLATPSELINAFGVITGMDKSWFNNVKDTPNLKAAIHTAGIGGRKGREPLYFVFPVMQWLISEKRRKGKPMNESTGWRLLKNQFPKVYAEYQGYEPD